MLFEVAIIEMDSLGKPTGRFEVTNVLASDGDSAKMRAAAASPITTALPAGFNVVVQVRSF